MKDRRNASQIKNVYMMKRMGTGKGNWGTDLEGQMMAVDSEYIWEMDTNETETEDVVMAVAGAEVEVAKSGDAASKTDTTDAKKEEPEKAVVRRNKKGHIILEIVRNFGVRSSKKEAVASEEQGPDAGDEAKKRSAKPKETGLDAKKLEELRKAAALRFKKKGAAWGGVKKQKVSPIKEELKQKSNPKK